MKSKLFLLIFLVAGCTGKKGSENASASQNVKFEQYLVEGQQLYQIHCANCHQLNGEGLAKLYPPLAKSDYLMADINRAICIQKNGQQGEIIVNGVTFNQPMPGIGTLTNLEIAELTTYITNSWGNEHRMVSIKEVESALKSCE
ncbi:c-type cytochrome [Fulvivirga lutea]|uniref:Cytochrome c n=1 Tax=Fulvivirga lutea TaxID=2810512 RepID=A0A974WHY4_9BACT|nr:cytochrome c [Fulvivirga lutea]QSE98894.1 cytochrome c [Fulvivirga lutea]